MIRKKSKVALAAIVCAVLMGLIAYLTVVFTQGSEDAIWKEKIRDTETIKLVSSAQDARVAVEKARAEAEARVRAEEKKAAERRARAKSEAEAKKKAAVQKAKKQAAAQKKLQAQGAVVEVSAWTNDISTMQPIIDRCIGAVAAPSPYGTLIAEHDYCGGAARLGSHKPGDTVRIVNAGDLNGLYRAGSARIVPMGSATNVLGGLGSVILQTCIGNQLKLIGLARIG